MSKRPSARCIPRQRVLAVIPLITFSCGPVPPPAPQAPPPTLVATFHSSSGRTAVQYYAYSSGGCRGVGNCNYRGSLPSLPSFAQAEVFLSGFALETGSSAAEVGRISAEVHKYRYDPATGELDLGVAGQLSTNGQPYRYHITLALVLTDASAAKFTRISSGCTGVAQCRVVRSLPQAVPSTMQYVGLGTRTFDLGSNSGPIVVNALSIHQDGLTVTASTVQIDQLCALQQASMSNSMFCEWDASVIAFDPAEVEKNNSPIFPQYTFVANVSVAQRWTEHAQPGSGLPASGFLNAFEGLTLKYGPGQSHTVWLVESSASSFRMSGSPSNDALTDYGVFLGTAFGDRVQTQSYGFQESRAFGFLR